MTMTHPGLPQYWGMIIWGFMIFLSLWALWAQMPPEKSQRSISLANIPFLGPIVRFLSLSHWPLLLLKIIIVAIFLLVIFAGLYGTSIPERNLATVLTWNIWWAGLIVSIFFLGSSWCAICPWDSLATWMVKPKLWLTNNKVLRFNNSLELTPPIFLRSVWPALLMFIGLTWLELGVGVTIHPYATALLSLLMIVLATISLALYKNKAFCRYFCPVGRTIGFYSQLAPIELRPIKQDICNDCTTMECYNGNDNIDACPTQLVMGTLKQNTYCTACGNCVQSCPQQNVSWRLRPQSNEAVQNARPHWDEAWFMLGLMALTSFHGLTMMPFWEQWISQLAQIIGDSGQLLTSFSIGLMISMVIPVILYSGAIVITQKLYQNKFTNKSVEIKALFTGLVFITLPLAFAYHIAHNLNHLVREGAGLFALFLNPLGTDTLPLTMMAKHNRHFDMLISQDTLFAIQGGLMLFGFWIAVKVLRYRSRHFIANAGWRLLPMYLFIILINGFHLWLLTQPMIMRM
jgi:polyferredoxin